MENKNIVELISVNLNKGTANLDPRCKLISLILVGSITFFINSDLAGLLFVLGISIFIGFSGLRNFPMVGVLLFILINCLNNLIKYINIPGIGVIISIFGVTVLKIIPIVILARWCLSSIYMDDLMVALQNIKIPKPIIISLVVMFRYIPTLKTEYKMIKNTMDIRGLCNTWLKKLTHPIKTIEYILVPLLMRCLKVSDELAASAATRGMDKDLTIYSINKVKFSFKEYITIFFEIVFFIALLIIEYSSLGEITLWSF